MMDIETIRSYHEDAQFQAEYDDWLAECDTTRRLIEWFAFLDETHPINTWQDVPY